METLLITLVLLIFSISTEKNENSYQENEWNLIWEDNFDGNTLDTTKWTLNGEETFRYPRLENSDPEQIQWPFNRPFYFIFSQQLGGSWVGEVNPDHLPVSMIIDWVKVYQQRK